MSRFVGRYLSSALGLVGALLIGACSDKPSSPELGHLHEKSQILVPETEPNPVFGQATPIAGRNVVLKGNVFPVGDVDLYSFTAAANDRVYVATQTAFAQNSTNTILQVLDTDGTTVLETDDENGTFSGNSSTIAGRELLVAGTYFVRVTAGAAPPLPVTPYQLHFQLRSGTPTDEVEPNNTQPTAQPLPTVGEPGWISGALSAQTDVDNYSINLLAGDTLFVSLDLDPERDNTIWNGVLGIGAFGSSNQILLANDSGTEAGADSEAHFVTVKNAGLYYVNVLSLSGATNFGNYGLSVSVHPASPVCTPYTISPALALADNALTTSTLTVPENIVISDIDVNVAIAHALPAELDVHLVAPGGNDVGLFTDLTTVATAPNVDFTLDDEAGNRAGSFQAHEGMILQPEQGYRLEWFDGQRAQGTWTLRVSDDAAATTGTLNSWGITICSEAPPPACPLGTSQRVVFTTDFESGAAGFTHSGTLDEWELGLPTAAPITTCNSGVNCWKTDLDGTYNPSSTQDLLSSPVNLAGVVAPIRLRWAQRYQMDSAAFDHASVDIRNVGGTSPTRVFEHLGPQMTDVTAGAVGTITQMSAGWSERTADIGAYAGNNVEVAFHVDSDANGIDLAGLAIDDVSVIGCAAVTCGDGQLGAGEQCDDGNTNNGDCCSSTCQFEALDSACADTNLCNGAETCNGAGVCGAGTPLVCNDGNACTDDSCVPATGCTTTPNTAPCSDNNACTTGDVCGGGSCQPGGPTVCNDGNACTDDSCVPATGCTTTPNTAPCSDNNACTTGDVCGGGSCQPGGPTVCNDGNACTDDSCVPATGCTTTPNTAPCSDNNACTTGDVCGGGSCQPGGPTVCNDGNACTDDSCVPATGCTTTPNTAPCSDNNACTTGDVCGGGSCQPGGPTVCNDGNACTDDSCVPATGCTTTNNTAPCPDNDLCDGAEVCGNGTCNAGTPLVCNDGNVCTNDSCVPATGCTTTNNTAPCPDNDLCDGAEVCGNGTCNAGAPLVCNDGNVCTDDSCAPATGCATSPNTASCSDNNACTTGDVCGSGTCQPGTPAVIDDGNVCTADACTPGGGVTHTPVMAGTSCADADLCNGAETCNGSGTCAAGSPVVCTPSDACHLAGACAPTTGVCSNPTAPDGTACPTGTCQSGACVGAGGAGGGGGGGAGGAGGATGGASGGGAGGATGGVSGGGAGGAAGAAGGGGAAGAAGGGGAAGMAGGAAGAAGSGGGAAGAAGRGGAAGASGSGGTPTGGTAGESGAGAGGDAGAGAGGDAGAGMGGEAGDTATGGSTTGGSAGRGGSATGGSSGTAGEEPGGAGGEATGGTDGKGKGSGSDEDSGCGCEVPGGSERRGLPLFGAGLLLVFAVRRRRTRTAA